VNKFQESRWLRSGTESGCEYRDFEILPHVVTEFWHSDIGGLESGNPEQFFKAILNLAFVSGSRRALLQ